jgi:DNA polymerase elongation subunit (family B)
MDLICRLVKVNRDGSKIILVLRDLNLKKRIVEVVDFKPYFYVEDEKGDYVSIYGNRLRKVYASDPSEVPSLREKYGKHYEADIPYTRRFMIDTNISDYVEIPDKPKILTCEVIPTENNVNIPLRTWYMDIEISSDTLPTYKNPIYPICSISLFDSYLNRYFTVTLSDKEEIIRIDDWTLVFVKSEDDLVQFFIKTYGKAQPDIIAGWNIDFDINYLTSRLKKLGYEFTFRDCQIFDVLEGFKILHKRSSYRLKTIAVEEGFAETYESFSKDMKPMEMAKYNLNDVKYIVMLDRKYKLLDYYWNLKVSSGVNLLSDTFANSVMIDTALLRLTKSLNIVLPSKHEVEKLSYEGAVVLEPPKGIYGNVAVFDMNRYYPSIIISFNISPETISGEGDIVYGGLRFTSHKEGVIPTLCKYFMRIRDDIDSQLSKLNPNDARYEQLKLKSNAVKYLINAIYGFLGFEGSRIYDVKLAEAVTAIGREGILKTKEIVEKYGYKVLYSDTDSVMVQIPFSEVPKITESLNKEITEYFTTKYKLKNCVIKLKCEMYFDKVIFFGVKKRYAAHVVYEKGAKCDKIKITGLEAIRTDQSNYSRYVQRKLIELILKGASKEEIVSFVKECIKNIYSQKLTDIAIVKGIDKELDKYKTIPPHVRGALYSNMYLGTRFRGGSRVYVVWIRNIKGFPKTDVVAFDEDIKLPEIEIDWGKMIDVNIIQKVDELLNIVGVDVKSLITSAQKLDRWL